MSEFIFVETQSVCQTFRKMRHHSILLKNMTPSSNFKLETSFPKVKWTCLFCTPFQVILLRKGRGKCFLVYSKYLYAKSLPELSPQKSILIHSGNIRTYWNCQIAHITTKDYHDIMLLNWYFCQTLVFFSRAVDLVTFLLSWTLSSFEVMYLVHSRRLWV